MRSTAHIRIQDTERQNLSTASFISVEIHQHRLGILSRKDFRLKFQ